MVEKKVFDFYTREGNIHFARETMTDEEAKRYARKFKLRFEEKEA